MWIIGDQNKTVVDQLIDIGKERVIERFLHSKGRNIKCFFKIKKNKRDNTQMFVKFMGSHFLKNKTNTELFFNVQTRLTITGESETLRLAPNESIGLMCPDRGELSVLFIKKFENEKWEERVPLSFGFTEFHSIHEQLQILKFENDPSLISCFFSNQISGEEINNFVSIKFGNIFNL